MLGLGLHKKSTMIGSSGMMIGKREDEIVPDEAIQNPAEQQYREAFALAGEANRTMAEAKEAVRRLFCSGICDLVRKAVARILVHASRVEVLVIATRCVLIVFPRVSSKVVAKRFSMWKGGKGKGKPTQYNEISASLSPAALATSPIFMSEHDIGTKAVVDTGASENADAAGSLARTVERRETPSLFEIIGSDVFEYESEIKKYKFLLIRGRASGLVMVDLLAEYGGEDGPSNWEPKTEDVLKSFGRWMMHNPAPRWTLDPATYFTSQQMMDFAGRSGIGLLTSTAEAHQMLGNEEGAIGVLKMTVDRLLREVPDVSIELAFVLACRGRNMTVGPSGFSPFQWSRGAAPTIGSIPEARVAFEMSSAKTRLSKLNNAVTQPSTSYNPGQLVMLWRQKQRPGKVGGAWVAVRHLLAEGHTHWVATGAELKATLKELQSFGFQSPLTVSFGISLAGIFFRCDWSCSIFGADARRLRGCRDSPRTSCRSKNRHMEDSNR